jgi:hypothetical protein
MQSLLDGNQFAKTDEQLEVVRDVAVDGFYEYLDEHLDSRNAVMGLLLKYKQRSEWFRRERLRAIAAAGLEGQRPGELSLAVDMREYVFDEGVEFTIEPTSASGEADLVLRDTSGEHIVIDAKYLPPGVTPSVIKEKLAAGFHQVARYCDDFQEPSGYLVVFINDARTPRLQLDERDGFRFLTVKGKVVYYVPISIADLPSASKSGPAQEIDVAQDELLRLIEAAAGTAGAAEPKNAEASS